MFRGRLVALVAALAIAAVLVVETATGVVPATKAADVTSALTAHALAPGICSGLGLTTVAYDDGNFVAPGFAQLVLGGPAAQTITGTPGNDCIIGGAGADVIDGGAGNDVCIGNAATIFTNCETQVIQ